MFCGSGEYSWATVTLSMQRNEFQDYKLFLNLNVFTILIVINCYVFKCLYYFYLYPRKTQTILSCRYSRNFVLILFTLLLILTREIWCHVVGFLTKLVFVRWKRELLKKMFSPDDVNSQQSMKRRVLWSPRC